MVTVVHSEVDAFTSGPDYNTIANDIAAHLQSPYLACLASAITLQDVTVTAEDYPGSVPAQGIHSVQLAAPRAPGDFKLDPAICALIHLSTATPKRYARGHIFVPPAYTVTAVSGQAAWNTADPHWNGVTSLANAYPPPFAVADNSTPPT